MSAETYQEGAHFKALKEAVLMALSKMLEIFFHSPKSLSRPVLDDGSNHRLIKHPDKEFDPNSRGETPLQMGFEKVDVGHAFYICYACIFLIFWKTLVPEGS